MIRFSTAQSKKEYQLPVFQACGPKCVTKPNEKSHASKLDEAELPIAISVETPVSQHLKTVTLRELDRAKKLKVNTLQAPRPTGCPWRVPRSRTWPERSQFSVTLPKEDCALKEAKPRGLSLSWNVRESTKMEKGRDEQTTAVRQTQILWQDIQTNSHKTPKFSTTPLRAKLQKRNDWDWYHNANLDVDEPRFDVPKVPSMTRFDVPKVPSMSRFDVPKVPSMTRFDVPKVPSMSRFDVRINKVVGEPSTELSRFEVSDHVVARAGPKSPRITLEKISKRIQLPITLGSDILSPKNKMSCTYHKFQHLPTI